MDHLGIIKRAWKTLWDYKALWIFGILVALASGGAGGGGGARSNIQSRGRTVHLPSEVQLRLERWGRMVERMFGRDLHGGILSGLLVLVSALMCLAVIFIVASTIARFVAEASLIKMVDCYATEGVKLSVKEGLRLGCSRAAWRLFLLRLTVMLPLSLIFMALAAVAASPLLLWVTKSNVLGILGTATAIGLLFLVAICGAVVFTVATVVLHLSARAVVLSELGVLEGLNVGAEMTWKGVKDVGLMWLIMFGIRLGYGLLMIPVSMLAVLVAALLGGASLLAVRLAADVLFQTETAWAMGFLAGVPVFIIAVSVPLVFIGGLWETFGSTVWTYTYRELTAMGVGPVPKLESHGLSLAGS